MSRNNNRGEGNACGGVEAEPRNRQVVSLMKIEPKVIIVGWAVGWCISLVAQKLFVWVLFVC